MKNLYLPLRAHIEANCPSIQHVRLYNNQYEREERGEQIPFPKPAIFIEFPDDINWTKMGKGIRQAENLKVRLHLVHEFYNGPEQEENLIVFDLRDEASTQVEEFKSDKITNYVLQSEKHDANHDNIYVLLMDFTTNYMEVLTERIRNKQVVMPPIKLTVQKEIIIDNPDIRTGVLDANT